MRRNITQANTENDKRKISERYKNLSNAELEVRFRAVDKEFFANFVNGANSSKDLKFTSVERSIDTIVSLNQNEKNIRKQILSDSKNVVSDTRIRKIRELELIINGIISYKIALNREVPMQFSLSNNSMMRFKNRISYGYLDWRVDITAVVNLNVTINESNKNDVINKIKYLKDALILPYTANTYISTMETIQNNIMPEYKMDYEIEIEHIGQDKSNVNLAIIEDILNIVNPELIRENIYQSEIYAIAKLIKSNKNIHYLFERKFRLKKLVNQALAMNKYLYKSIFPPYGYYLTEKADGIRCLVSTYGDVCRILADKLIELKLSESRGGESQVIEYLLDGELLYDKDGKFTIYVFDIMITNGENISGRGFNDRIQYLQKGVEVAKKFGNFHAKQFVKLEEGNLEKNIKEVFDRNHPYNIDGLIFTSPNDPYEYTKNYKWKPSEDNTIDFLAYKCELDDRCPKRAGYDMYILFVGISYQEQSFLGLDFLPYHKELIKDDHAGGDLYPIHFAPAANPYAYRYYHKKDLPDINGRIVELGRKNDEWVFNRIREDRKFEKEYFGNFYKIAEITYMNFIDPFELKDLWSPSVGYFNKMKDNIYSAYLAYNRISINISLKKYLKGGSGNLSLIDLASGRGGAFLGYQEIGIKNALFIDKDPTALSEFIERRYELAGKYTGKKGMNISILAKDLSDNYKSTMEDINKFDIAPVDYIVCNFAIHYFCNTAENLQNFLLLVNSALKPGGVFMMTSFDGKSVFDLLSKYKQGEEWIVKEDSIKKYAIKKLYASNTLTNIGQKISVKLPMGDEMYDEYLCNYDHIKSVLTKLKFKITADVSFSEFENEFNEVIRATKKRYGLMPDDKKYISLYHTLVAVKENV